MLRQFEKYLGKKITVTSGVRSPDKNKQVGGADKSRHLLQYGGDARDIKVAGMTPAEVAKKAREFGFGGVGVYKGHVHVDLGPKRSWVG